MNADTKSFIDFVLSDEGQDIIASQKTVNLRQGKALLEIYKEALGMEAPATPEPVDI